MSTTKVEIERVLTEVDVFTENAATLVRSHMPTGLGAYWQREQDELEQMLVDVNARFEQAIRKAQRAGWAAK